MVQEKPDISVILPVYKNDCAKHFSLAIDSLLSQTLEPAEIIVVIDGPISSELSNLIAKYISQGPVRKLEIPTNKGLAHALNLGINAAKYPLIARMDADDICIKDRLERQAALLLEKELDLVGGQVYEFGRDTSDLKSERIVPTEHQEIIAFMKLRSPFSHPTILFKKTLFEAVGGYSEKYAMEDYEYFIRCHLQKAKFGNVKEKVLYYRVGPNYEVLKRRSGITYAKSELALYCQFYKLGYYQAKDVLKAAILKVPLRLLPLSLFRFIYTRLFRKPS